MSGYQVQNPNLFNSAQIQSPFTPTDGFQNDQIYRLQNYSKMMIGNAATADVSGAVPVYPTLNNTAYPDVPVPGAGYIDLPESCTDPNTPFELNVFQYLNQRLRLNTPANPDAYPEGFDPSLVKVYYVKLPLGITYDGERLNYDDYVPIWQLIKGTYGFNQIPIGFSPFQVNMAIGRGTSICLGVPTDLANPNKDANNVWWYAAFVNQLDYCGASYILDLSANTALSAEDLAILEVSTGRSFVPFNVYFDTYNETDDLVFATLFPAEYNTPASKCPVAQTITYGLGQQTWLQPL